MMVKVKDQSLDYFNLIDKRGVVLGVDFRSIPETIFSNVLDLVIFYSKLRLEILFYIYYDSNNNYVVTVPRQKVSEYRIKVLSRDDKDYKEIDLLSKKVVNTNNLLRLGSIHSHHELRAEFSIDDDISDFNAPPGLHILLGEFPNIKVVTSAAIFNKRYYLNPSSIIDYSAAHYLYQANQQIDKAITEQLIKY